MKKQSKLVGAMIVMLLLQPLSWVSANELTLTADEIVANSVANLQGPAGKAFVIVGRMQFPGEASDICAVRQVSYQGMIRDESFDVLFGSPGTDPATGVVAAGGRRYRFVLEEGKPVVGLFYSPATHRGRDFPYDADSGVIGSDYKQYYLLVSHLVLDFKYIMARGDPDNPVVSGMRRDGVPTPYDRCLISFERHGSAYTPREFVYYRPSGRSELRSKFEDYREVEGAPGYWLPRSMKTGETEITIKQWLVVESDLSRFSTNHAALETKPIPCR